MVQYNLFQRMVQKLPEPRGLVWRVQCTTPAGQSLLSGGKAR
jgi:hypothetical protein